MILFLTYPVGAIANYTQRVVDKHLSADEHQIALKFLGEHLSLLAFACRANSGYQIMYAQLHISRKSILKVYYTVLGRHWPASAC